MVASRVTGHSIDAVLPTPLHVVVVCECGHRSQHPKREGAEKRHATHVQIETARAALRGEGDT